MTTTQMTQSDIEIKLDGRYTSGIRTIAKRLGIDTTRASRQQLITWTAQELSLTKNAPLLSQYRLNG